MIKVHAYSNQQKLVVSVEPAIPPKIDEIFTGFCPADSRAVTAEMYAEANQMLATANTITAKAAESAQHGLDQGITVWTIGEEPIELEVSNEDIELEIDGVTFNPWSYDGWAANPNES